MTDPHFRHAEIDPDAARRRPRKAALGVGRHRRPAAPVPIALCRAQPGGELPRPARLARQLRPELSVHDALPARGDGGPGGARLRQGIRPPHGRDRAQPGRPAALQPGRLLRLYRPRAGVHRRRDRPDGREQAPPPHRLDPHGERAGTGGSRLYEVGLSARVDRRSARIIRARLRRDDDRAAGADVHVLRRLAAGAAARSRGAAAAADRRCRCRRPSRRTRPRWRAPRICWSRQSGR